MTVVERDGFQEEQVARLAIGELLEAPASRLSPALKALRSTQESPLREWVADEPAALVIDRTQMPVPVAVVTATEEIMRSQGDFLTTWLAPFLRGERDVVLTENDLTDYSAWGDDPFGSLARIKVYQENLVQLEPRPPGEMERFVEKMRAVVAANRITYAVVNKETEHLRTLLASGVLITLGFSALEAAKTLPALYRFIYAVASTADNSVAIIGETIKLREQGKTLEQALRTMAFPALVLAASWGLAPVIDEQFGRGHVLQAGVLYGLESSVCVVPTVVGGASQYRYYIQLVKEDKVTEPRLKKLLEQDAASGWDKLEILGLAISRALSHDLIYPHHLGFYVGAVIGLAAAMVTATIPSWSGKPLLQQRFILGPVGIADSIGGTLFSLANKRIYDRKLRRDLEKLAAH